MEPNTLQITPNDILRIKKCLKYKESDILAFKEKLKTCNVLKSFCYLTLNKHPFLKIEYQLNNENIHLCLPLKEYFDKLQWIFTRQLDEKKLLLHQELYRKINHIQISELHDELLRSYWHIDNILFWNSQRSTSADYFGY